MSGAIVAVVHDPNTIGGTVAAAQRLGLSVMLSRGGWQLAEEVTADTARLLMVDLDIPGISGPEGCERIRAISDLPLLALGERGDSHAIVEALRAGADCYLAKPVEVDLLEAHLEALLRRPPMRDRPTSITVRDLTIDFLLKKVRFRGEPIPLTPAEYRLLACLARQPGKVVPSSELLREMSGYECGEQEAQEIVKVHVSRLRGKIDRASEQPSYILNVRGFGYLLERRMVPPSEPSVLE